MRYLGIDPGSKKCGWAVVDLSRNTVVDHGHDDLDQMRKIINGFVYSIDGIVIEVLRVYKVSNANDLLPTAYAIGRLQEMHHDAVRDMNSNNVKHTVELLEFTRPEVIFRLTGRWPGRTHKVSKADLQGVVQRLLQLDKPIRPQHANDAAALVVATTHPVKAILNVKPKRKARAKAEPGRRTK